MEEGENQYKRRKTNQITEEQLVSFEYGIFQKPTNFSSNSKLILTRPYGSQMNMQRAPPAYPTMPIKSSNWAY